MRDQEKAEQYLKKKSRASSGGGRTGAASDIVKVKDWVQPFCSAGIIKQSHTRKRERTEMMPGTLHPLALPSWTPICESIYFPPVIEFEQRRKKQMM